MLFGAIAHFGATAPASPVGQSDRAIILAILEASDAGRYDEIVPQLTRVRVSETFGPELLQSTRYWVSDAEGPIRERRLRVASQAALEVFEYAAIAPNLDVRDLPPLLEWASSRLASRMPDDFEHQWYLGAVAVAGASLLDAMLTGYRGLRFEPSDHGPLLEHARKRFPHEPRFELAEVAIRRVARTIANRPGMELPQLTGLSARNVRGRDMVRHVEETLAGLDALASRENIGAEARLRAGVIRFHWNRLDESLTDLRAASMSNDPFIGYVASLMEGHVRRLRGDDEAAIEAWRRANAAIPNVVAGATLLSSALFLADRRDEAYDVMDAALRTRPKVPDPWLQYGWGDYRFWPEIRSRLRRLTRP